MMSGSDSSSGGERDWNAILQELQSQKEKVKNLESKLQKQKAEKQNDQTNPSEQANKEIVRRSPRRSPRKQTPRKQTPRKQTPRKQTPRKQTPRKQTPHKKTPRKQTPRKRKSPHKDSSPIMKKRLLLTSHTRTPKERLMQRIHKILGIAIKLNLDKAILAGTYRCCFYIVVHL